jgi:plasmid stability protein
VATLTIRDLDDALKLKLRLRAASQNRSMEEEARQILCVALQQPAPAAGTLVARVRKRFDGLGDVQLADAQIAAMALRNGAALATRNLKDFEGCGLRLIDPWA